MKEGAMYITGRHGRFRGIGNNSGIAPSEISFNDERQERSVVGDGAQSVPESAKVGLEGG